MLKKKRLSNKKSKAAALIVTLSVIVLLAVLVVSLVTAMRMERQASHYYVERARAELLAREAVEYVRASISEATATGHYWVTMPGQIVTTTNKFDDPSTKTILLNSGIGNPSAIGDILGPADLNRVVVSDDRMAAIAPNATPMLLKWIYIRKDGERDTNQNPNLTDTNNPIVGRFAYWTDDESARINLNTAWKRQGNTNSVNHPTKVNLLALPEMTEALANEIHDIATNKAFNSPDEARRFNTAMAAAFSTNRLALSHYSHSSANNPWGSNKLVLTTSSNNLPETIRQLGNAATNYYLSSLANDSVDSGRPGNVSTNRLYPTLNRIMAYFKRSDWPYGSGSFQNKYGDLNCAQLALNIVDYVRSAESTNSMVQPTIRVLYNGTEFVSAKTDDEGTNIMCGSTRAPMISEVAVSFSEVMQKPNVAVKNFMTVFFKTEVCIPKSYNIDPNSLVGLNMDVSLVFPYPGVFTGTECFRVNADATIGSGSTLKVSEDGNYYFATITSSREFRPSTRNNELYRPDTVYLRTKLYHAPSGEFYDLASVSLTSEIDKQMQFFIKYKLDAPDTIATSAQVSDPRINKFQKNWEQSSETFDKKNFNWTVNVGSSPPQDTDSSYGAGNVSDASLSMPPPKGSAENIFGVVDSIAELGHIPTGTITGIPWRSLRFQPNSVGADIPDWALADVFMAPYFPAANANLYTPTTNTIAGRINLNGKLSSFTNIDRSFPLQALFKTNNDAVLDTPSLNVISNINDRIPATDGKLYGGTNGYVSAGEMVEIKGLADSGEASEKRLHGIIDLAAVQGNVFRIYAAAQALAQTPQGKLIIQAESSIMAMMEREASGTSKIIFWKVLPL